MSIPSQTILENRPAVLVRAFQDQPVKARALSVVGSLIEVAGADEHASLRLRSGDVYEFSEPLHRRLESAYRKGDEQKLAELWGEGHPFNPTATHN